jgi:hypothetical protein
MCPAFGRVGRSRMPRLIIALLVLAATTPSACSSSVTTPGTASPTASPGTSDAMRLDGAFTRSADGQLLLSGRCTGVASTGVPVSPGTTPDPAASSEWRVTELSVEFYAPANIDGASGALLLKLHVLDDSRVYGEQGMPVPRSAQYQKLLGELGEARWTARVAPGDHGELIAVELRRLGESDAPIAAPAVTGLLQPLDGGLLFVPGRPGDQSAGAGARTWLEMVQPVLVEGLRMAAVTRLAVDRHSRVVTHPSARARRGGCSTG